MYIVLNLVTCDKPDFVIFVIIVIALFSVAFFILIFYLKYLHLLQNYCNMRW